ANKAFAEDLIPRALAMRRSDGEEPYLTRVDYRRDTAFMERNALYFATDAELDSLEGFLQEQVEAARLEANPFFFDLDDLEVEEGDGPGADGDGSAPLGGGADALATVYDELVGT